MQLIQFVFGNFWHWLGSLLLVLAASRLTLVRVHTHSKVNSPTDDHSTNDNHNE